MNQALTSKSESTLVKEKRKTLNKIIVKLKREGIYI